jgi:hypothetical protein
MTTFKRFPLVTFSAYLMTIILFVFSIVGHASIEQYPNYNVANKISFLTTLAMPLFFVLRLLSTRRIFIILGIVFLVGYYAFVLPEKLEGASSDFFKQHFLFVLALMIFSFVAPFLFRPIKNEDFWEWSQQILFALLSSLIFGGILFLGLEGAKYALEKLFNISMYGHNIEEQFALLIFGIFGVNYFLSQIPRNPHFILSRPYTKIENIFTKYILTPLVIGYFSILFLYTAKIVWLSQWPTGVMAWLIVLFSALAIVTLLFWTPLWNEKNQKYKKWIWISILIQTFVLAISIYLRIEQYGVTENRYFISLFGVWLAVTSLYFIFFSKASYKWLFMSIPLLIVLSQFGPFSSKNISKQSQIRQLKSLIGNSESLSKETNASVKYQISSKIIYLYEKHGIDALLPVIPEIVSSYKLRDNDSKNCESTPFLSFPDYATDQLGFQYINQWEWEERNNRSKIEAPIFIHTYGRSDLNITGYDWLQYFSFQKLEGEELYCPPSQSRGVKSSVKSMYNIETKEKSIVIKKDSEILASIEIGKFFSEIKTKWKEKRKEDKNIHLFSETNFKAEELTLYDGNASFSVKIIFNGMSFNSKDIELNHYSGQILIHEE